MAEGFSALAELASRQHGIVTLQQVRDAGLSRQKLDRLLAGKRLIRVAPRAFRVHGAPDAWQARVLAECLSAGSDVVASHRTAAALYGLDGFGQERTIHLSLPRGRSPRERPNIRLHPGYDFELVEATTQQAIPVTGIARTLLDLYASERNPAVARRALFSARKKKLVTWTDLAACLAAHSRKGRRGTRRLRADLRTYAVEGCPETGFEDEVVALLVAAGLPRPEVQHWVTAGGRRYRLDAAYPPAKLGIECRSKKHHLTDEAFEADPLREADLGIDGWLVLQVTWAQLQLDPQGVVRRVERALERRLAQAVPLGQADEGGEVGDGGQQPAGPGVGAEGVGDGDVEDGGGEEEVGADQSRHRPARRVSSHHQVKFAVDGESHPGGHQGPGRGQAA